MRSQKQSNRAPRPFKNQNSTKGWSGGNQGFIPAPKVNLHLKKIALPSAPEKVATPAPKDADGAGTAES